MALPHRPRLVLIALGVLAGTPSLLAETAYFLLSGRTYGTGPQESYVVTVSDPELIRKARDYLRGPRGIPYLIPAVGIDGASDPINRNYSEPGAPVWPWRTTTVTEWIPYDPNSFKIALFIPEAHSPASEVPALLADGKSSMELVYFPLVMELDPTKPGAVINESTRAWVGTGERVMITGFIVQGGTPRNVLVRALGPSLAQFGITEPLADPKIEIFHGSEKIAENNDWLDGNFAPRPGIPEEFPSSFAWLFPSHESEAATHLSLQPGSYTMHVSGVDGGTGIALAEVYDLDAMAPP